MKKITQKFVRTVKVNQAVAQWNSWDHEHLYHIHGRYKDIQILFETSEVVVMLMRYKLPLFSFICSESLMVTIKCSDSSETNFNMGLFSIPSSTKILYEETGQDECKVTTTYQFFLKGWRVILAPFIPKMIERWNTQVWEEDLPVKLRRQKVLRAGFKDFEGLPANVQDRFYKGPLPFKLPIPRPKKSPINELIS